jgi:hypothetical protein
MKTCRCGCGEPVKGIRRSKQFVNDAHRVRHGRARRAAGGAGDRFQALDRAIDPYRAEAIEAYGGRCVICGTTKRLEIDHINGDGAEHRLQPGSVYLDLKRRGWPPIVQVLCHKHHLEKTTRDRLTRKLDAAPRLEGTFEEPW